MRDPLDDLTFPVWCEYTDCGAGPFHSGIEVDEHICEEHHPEAIWNFAEDFIKTRAE